MVVCDQFPLVPAEAGTQALLQKTGFPLSRERTEYISTQNSRALARVWRGAAMSARSYAAARRVLNKVKSNHHGNAGEYAHDRSSSGIHRGPRQETWRTGPPTARTSSACRSIDKSRTRHGLPHGRPQAAARGRCRRRAGHRLLRLGDGGRRRARRDRRASREGGHQGRARLARARRRAAGQGPRRLQRSRRQPPRVLPRRRGRLRSVQARPQHLRLPHRLARHGPRGDALRAPRRGDAVLPGDAGVQAVRLLAAAVRRLLLPRQRRAIIPSRWSRPARRWSIT